MLSRGAKHYAKLEYRNQLGTHLFNVFHFLILFLAVTHTFKSKMLKKTKTNSTILEMRKPSII